MNINQKRLMKIKLLKSELRKIPRDKNEIDILIIDGVKLESNNSRKRKKLIKQINKLEK